MRLFQTPAFVLVIVLLSPSRLQPDQIYNPPPALDLPLPLDPPDPFSTGFDPFGLPGPFDFPFPPEDPWDDPTINIPLPPDPFDVPDPLPDVPSLFPDPFDDLPDWPPLPPPSTSSENSAGLAARLAMNVLTPYMPFPARLLFPPAYSGVSAAKTTRACSTATARQLVAVESKKNTVAFVKTCPWQVVSHLAVGTQPLAVKGSPDGSQVLVANYGDGSSSGSVSVVAMSSHSVTKTIPFPMSPDGSPVQPNSIAFFPDGSKAYISSHGCNPGSFVYMIDMSALALTGSPIPVKCFPSSIAVTPDGSQLWISERGADTLEVIDTATGAAVWSFHIAGATGVRFNPTGTTAYVAESKMADVAVIDTATYTITTRISVGGLPHIVAVTPTGRHVFVTNGLSNSISMISTETNQVVRTINLPNGLKHPVGLVFLPR